MEPKCGRSRRLFYFSVGVIIHHLLNLGTQMTLVLNGGPGPSFGSFFHPKKEDKPVPGMYTYEKKYSYFVSIQRLLAYIT